MLAPLFFREQKQNLGHCDSIAGAACGSYEMKRRELFRGTLAVGAFAALKEPVKVLGTQDNASQAAKNAFPQVSGLTRYVAEFVLKLKYEDIPSEVIALAKKSILDGFGLALAGSASELGVLSRKYVQSLGIAAGNSTIIGSSLKTSPRFAAFANGIFIHADDFDDTQLAVAKDRVYGLLTHPTAPFCRPCSPLQRLPDQRRQKISSPPTSPVWRQRQKLRKRSPRAITKTDFILRAPAAPSVPLRPAREFAA